MNMHAADWLIVIGLVAVLGAGALYTRRFTRSVADFLVANRCANRYLITIAEGIMGIGAITVVAQFEMHYAAGFSAAWWIMMTTPALMIIGLSGWVLYRYRQTRCLTMGQFLEIRYSKRFRIFAGLVAYVSGMVNFGIFPAVGARFFIYFCGLPETFALLGWQVSTYLACLVALLSMALFFTYVGGQIAVIVTDFLQGTFCNIAFVVLLAVLLYMFDWHDVVAALKSAPADASMIHPFHTSNAKDFNVAFFLIQLFTIFATYMIWQGSQAYNGSARTPHEARMGKVIGTWRLLAQTGVILFLPIAAYAVMHGAGYARQAALADGVLATVENPAIRTQITVPVALSTVLPRGIMGLLCAVMLAAFISTHDTYLHSWGSIFIQDVIMPFRKKPFTPKQHLRLLRLSILGVGAFIFVWSLVFRQTEYIFMFFAITGAIYLGGAGAVIIGGLYWKGGTTRGAWSAMITGSTLAVSFVVLRQFGADFFLGIESWPEQLAFLQRMLAKLATLNGQWLSFISMMCAYSMYILVSLLDRQPAFNMDRMLHRGAYAVQDDLAVGSRRPVRGLQAIVGMGEEFTRGDKVIYLATVGWTVLWSGTFIIGTAANLLFDIDTDTWAAFWRGYLWMNLILGGIATVWLTVGGVIDAKVLFHRLKTIPRNDADDGMVVDHHIRGE